MAQIPGTTLPSRRPRESLPVQPADPAAPTLAEARAALGRGDARQAIAILERGLRDLPNDAQLRFLRAMAFQRLGRLQEAEDGFLTLTREFPELPEPYNNLAVVRAARGNLDGARIALEDAVRALPDYAIAHENLGDVYAQMAARSYQAALRLAPASSTARDKLRLVTQVPTPQSPAPGASRSTPSVPSTSPPSPSASPLPSGRSSAPPAETAPAPASHH